MSETIFTVTAIVVFVLVAAMVLFLAIQQRRARPMPGDREDVGGTARPKDARPTREGITSSGDMLPGPGPTGFGVGGRMKG